MPAYLVGPPVSLTLKKPRPRSHLEGTTPLLRDDLTTRSGMGAIADLFRSPTGLVRWRHPVHSLPPGSSGRDLCAGYEPLVRAGGSILLLGVQMDRCSASTGRGSGRPAEEIRRVRAWPVPTR